MQASHPDFRSPDFLRSHIVWIMDFYDPRATDPSGGMYQFFLDDGTVYDARTRHLVSATRYVVTYSMLYRLTRRSRYLQGVRHAVAFLRHAFRDPETGGYAWVIDWHEGKAKPVYSTRHMYGMSFVMLAYAHAAMAGIPGAADLLAETFQLAERFFWEPQQNLYADEATPQWALSSYRGQNANMHVCEALIAAYKATNESAYISRAETVAQSVTQRLAELGDGLIWEHYHADWSIDWEYNRHDKTNIFRPWGFQPGHLTEWAKFLVQLDQLHPAAWHVPRAIELFDVAVSKAWDSVHGGLCYGFAPDGSICDPDKYHWVQAESFAAAALLGRVTNEEKYWEWYDRLWNYCWTHFVDHQHGAWFRILDGSNLNHTREKSPAGKVDYHSIGACHDVLVALGEL